MLCQFPSSPTTRRIWFVCVALKQIWILAVYCFFKDTQLTSSKLHIQVDSFHVLKVSAAPELLLNLAGNCHPFYTDPLGTNTFLDRFFSDTHTLQALTFLSEQMWSRLFVKGEPWELPNTSPVLWTSVISTFWCCIAWLIVWPENTFLWSNILVDIKDLETRRKKDEIERLEKRWNPIK